MIITFLFAYGTSTHWDTKILKAILGKLHHTWITNFEISAHKFRLIQWGRKNQKGLKNEIEICQLEMEI